MAGSCCFCQRSIGGQSQFTRARFAAGSLLTSLGYFFASLITWTLLPLLWPVKSSLATLFTSDLYLVNLAIATATLALLATLYGVSRPAPTRRASQSRGGALTIAATAIFLIVAMASIYCGLAPISAAYAFATSPYSPAAAPALRHQVPPTFAATCRPDYLLLPGQAASLTCRADVNTEVSYHTFTTQNRLDHWYRAALQARGVPLDSGTCAQRWPAESHFMGPRGQGQVACYTDRRGAWLLWTADGALGIAFRADGRSDALASSWAAGAYWLQP